MMPGMSPPMPQPLAMKLGTELYIIIYYFILYLVSAILLVLLLAAWCHTLSLLREGMLRVSRAQPACDHHSKSWCVHMHSIVQHAGIAWHVSWPCRMRSFCHGPFIGTEKSAELPYVAVFS